YGNWFGLGVFREAVGVWLEQAGASCLLVVCAAAIEEKQVISTGRTDEDGQRPFSFPSEKPEKPDYCH
ncbi:hypothetical protein, partial [Pseudomonas kulmbachensis]|uniref:hypothetical protein n=1 Tax=Pseudomonas kulmbachensis TaxID=3043408 RepID=UPI002AAF53D2